MPEPWWGFFVYEKQVPASVVGGDPNELVYVGIRAVPMGFIGAVDLVQAWVRKIAFCRVQTGFLVNII